MHILKDATIETSAELTHRSGVNLEQDFQACNSFFLGKNILYTFNYTLYVTREKEVSPAYFHIKTSTFSIHWKSNLFHLAGESQAAAPSLQFTPAINMVISLESSHIAIGFNPHMFYMGKSS